MSETELREALAECDAVCTSGCHADDCEHHGHLPALAIPVEPALREAAKRVVEWAEWHEPWNPSGDFDALSAALASIHAEPEQADEVAGLDVERLATALCATNSGHYRGWDASIAHAVIDQDHIEEAQAIAAEYARLAPARDDTSAWLIERGQPERQVPTVWWTGSSWSSDANKAMRFPDRGAADAYNEEHSPIPAQRDRFGRVTEHRWLPDTSGGAS